MVEVAARGRDDADIESDIDADTGPLSCLRSREDPGRNMGRAAATGPVIANGVGVEVEVEVGAGGRWCGAGELQRDEEQQLTVPVQHCSLVAGPSGAALFQMPPRDARQGSLGSLELPALPVPVVGPLHVRAPQLPVRQRACVFATPMSRELLLSNFHQKASFL